MNSSQIAWKVSLPNFVNSVTFDNNSNLIVCNGANSRICYFTRDELPNSSPCGQSDGPVSVSLTNSVNARANIALPKFWIEEASADNSRDGLSLVTGIKDGFIAVCTAGNQLHRDKLLCWTATKSFVLETDVVVALASDATGQKVAIQFSDRRVCEFSPADALLRQWKDRLGREVILPQTCHHLQISHHSDVFALSDTYSLYRNNDVLLKTCCTSFLIHENSFLIYTTTANVLSVMALDKRNGDADGDEKTHPIERGSRLVTTTTDSAVLQAVRGNLESVCPRPFLWLTIDRLIQLKCFLKAFRLMRKHRMSFVLFVQRYSDQLLQSIDTFVDDLSSESVDHLVLFLTNLTDKLYKPSIKQPLDNESSSLISAAPKTNTTVDSKVLLICQRMRDAMEHRKDQRFLHPVLVTMLMAGDVGPALLMIKQTEGEERQDEALVFLLYFISVNDLFNEAIGTYDFDIVRLVAQKSHKDPKEYSKTLSQLQDLKPELYMRFRIDVSLGRYNSALTHVAECEDEAIGDEVLQLIESRKLFKQAVNILQTESMRKRVWHKYADYLLSKKYYSEAAIAYKRSGNRITAIRCHQLSGNWNQAISESLLLSQPNQLKTLSASLIDSLCSSGRHVEAALIADKYLSDVDLAVKILVQGCEWDSACRLIAQSQDAADGLTFLRHSLNSEAERLNIKFQQDTQSLKDHVIRLLQIRKEKQSQVEEQAHFSDETMSDISSVRSLSQKSGSSQKSLRTRASDSNSRKRDVRKWAKLKHGSRFEDVAIVLSCKEILVRTNQVQQEVGCLLRHLLENECTAEAERCRQAFRDLLCTAKSSIASVWVENLATTFRIDQTDLTPDFGEYLAPFDPKILPSFRSR